MHNDNENYPDRIKQLQEFNLMIAHNLRGGIHNIKQLTEMLIDKKISKNQLKKESLAISEGLQYIYDSSTALLDSLALLMEVTNIHLSEKKFDQCDIGAITSKIIDQLHLIVVQRMAEVELNLELTHISYPCAYIESILYNLISNALKYAKEGVPAKITISTYRKDNKNYLQVKDNGIGIDLAKYGSKVFKLNATFHKGYESKGIGLYLTKTQIDSLGGSISVTSEVGKGSEFTVAF